ncbi:MAG: efflux RND transporter periplasmic adaptor subunit [Chloroflexi bacterium]|nr:efflux RND transporter periplasmic adaptor subunit [Chloroflexota bacterium]
MRRGKRVWWWLLAILPLAGGVYLGKRYLDARGQASASTTGQVFAATLGNVTSTIDPTGQVEAVQSVALSFSVDRVTLLEMNVTAGEKVAEGQVLGRVDEEPLERAVQQARASLLSAEEQLETAKNPYTELDKRKAALDVAEAETALQVANEALEELRTPDLTDARAAVASAERALREARQSLASLQADTGTQEQIDVLQWKFNVAELDHGALLNQPLQSEAGQDREYLARNKMLDAQDALATAKLRAEQDLLAARNAVTKAQRDLVVAQGKLADLQAVPDALQLAQAQNKVTQAEYDLAKAQASAAEIAAGSTETAVKAAEAAYGDALATFDDAQTALENATLVAPFDATVVSVGARVGDKVSSGRVIVTLADLGELRVVASVDENDITKLAVGMPASITFDALTGQSFSGRVLEIPLESTLSNNVVTYAVPISLEGAEGVDLRSGMTANVTLVTGERHNVLLLPILAVQDSDDGPVVTLEDGTNTRVQTGINDGTYIEIIAGLNEGDRVLVSYDTSRSDQQDQFPGADFPGSGMPPALGGPMPAPGM